MLDEFYIYERILTSAEIKILAEQAKADQGIELDDQSLFSIYSQAVDPKALELQKNCTTNGFLRETKGTNWADHGNERNA